MMNVRYLMLVVIAAVFAGCETPGEPELAPIGYSKMQQAVDAYYERRDECKSIHGYDPDNPGDLGPNELAPNEKAWGTCAYDAVRATLMMETTQPRLYEAAMAEHRTMTDKVGAGLMTRDERETRMFELRKEIREKEIERLSTSAQLDRIPQGVMELIRSSSFEATRF